MDVGEHETMTEPGSDGCAVITRIKHARSERSKSKGYVKKEIEVAEPSSGDFCTCCGNPARWQGKCNECIRAEGFRWLEGILPDVEPDIEPDNGGIKPDEGDVKSGDEYLKILGTLYQQNQARIVEEKENGRNPWIERIERC
jgi:hypothetical protein